MTWKLHTNEDDFRVELERLRLRERGRKFALLTARTPDERADIESLAALPDMGLLVDRVLPPWLVLLGHRDATAEEWLWMVRSILQSQRVEDAKARGILYGYSADEIGWYVNELRAAWQRFYKWTMHNGKVEHGGDRGSS